jgi:His-Xaa-Ser system radical SAM maturase HxsB
MKKASGLQPAFFRFERLPGGVLVTNDGGRWALLKEKEFAAFAGGRVREGSALYRRLLPLNFFRERLDLPAEEAGIKGLASGLFSGPSLHILVLTLRCNLACVYCRASCGTGAGADMDWPTARRSVDLVFSSPAAGITIEFQGGEALLNWPVLERAVDYALSKNKRAGKDLAITVVTNLVLMDRAKLDFLVGRGVSVCTSLDGPADLHDANRRRLGGGSHALAEKWLKEIKRRARGGGKDSLPSALMTTTRLSLGREKEIVDEYRRLGLGGVFLRPLSPIGYAGSVWEEIGYPPSAFAAFYDKALSYIMRINLAGERFVERNAALLARKILSREDPNYLDLRSPCGAAAGQLAYNWDGQVYTCDEGRMVGARGDLLFRTGSCRDSSAADQAASPASRLCAMASCLESQHHCFRCAYKPYCGVCPVHNYETQGSPWGNIAAGSWCAVQKGIFAAVFRRLSSPRERRVIESWIKGDGR